jgi:glycosyltransferase involved in cell wall biosynthesis
MADLGNATREVLLPIITDLGTDRRCFKMARSLKKMGYTPVVLCDKPHTRPGPAWEGYNVKILSRYSHRERFMRTFIEYLFRLAVYLVFTRSMFWIVEDCPPLFLVALLGRLRKRTVIYDAHEIFTESPELENRPVKKRFWSLWQNSGIRLVNKIIAVSPDFIEYFRSRFPEKGFYYLPNVPLRGRPISSRPSRERFVLIYLGFLRTENSLKALITAMAFRTEYELIVVGDGPELSTLKQQIGEAGIEDRVQLVGRVPFEKLPEYTGRGHIGIHLVHAATVNIDLTLPNKIFDYISEGQPVLLGRTTALTNLLKNYPVGIQVDAGSADSVGQGLDRIRHEYETLSRNCLKAREELCWERFEQGLGRFIE